MRRAGSSLPCGRSERLNGGASLQLPPSTKATVGLDTQAWLLLSVLGTTAYSLDHHLQLGASSCAPDLFSQLSPDISLQLNTSKLDAPSSPTRPASPNLSLLPFPAPPNPEPLKGQPPRLSSKTPEQHFRLLPLPHSPWLISHQVPKISPATILYFSNHQAQAPGAKSDLGVDPFTWTSCGPFELAMAWSDIIISPPSSSPASTCGTLTLPNHRYQTSPPPHSSPTDSQTVSVLW